jgi:hypothetical protein
MVWFKGPFRTCRSFAEIPPLGRIAASAFFDRDNPASSAIVSSSPRDNRPALSKSQKKCFVIPVGYVILGICRGGPHSRRGSPQIWPHLPVLLLGAIGGLRNLNGLLR